MRFHRFQDLLEPPHLDAESLNFRSFVFVSSPAQRSASAHKPLRSRLGGFLRPLRNQGVVIDSLDGPQDSLGILRQNTDDAAVVEIRKRRAEQDVRVHRAVVD